MSRLRALARDPFSSSLVTLGALLVAGFVALGLSWRGVAARLEVAAQVPFVVSGGLGGLAAIAFAAAVLAIQARRWSDARQRAQLERLTELAIDLLEIARTEPKERRP